MNFGQCKEIPGEENLKMVRSDDYVCLSHEMSKSLDTARDA